MSPTAQPGRLCAACGASSDAGAKFCKACGVALTAAVPPEALTVEKRPVVASPVGGHRKSAWRPGAPFAMGAVALAIMGLAAGALFLSGGGSKPVPQSPPRQVASTGGVTGAAIGGSAFAGYPDAATYCRVVGTIDRPDQRYGGPAAPQWMMDAVGLGPEGVSTLVWRCRESAVVACVRGEDSRTCAKRDLNSVPTAEMEQYCRAAPDEPFIGGETTPPGTVYSWFCDGETPTIRGQDSYPDAQGYDPNDWKTVSP